MLLHKLNNLKVISKSFNISIEFLDAIYNNKLIDEYIELFKIPKKNPKFYKKYREVINIQPPYNLFYKELLYIIEKEIEHEYSLFISEIAHGFIKNRGVLTNAKEHLNKKYLLKIDIKDFFKSINLHDVEKSFLKLGFSEDGAKIFSKLSTFNDILYEGFNTSPILANIICYKMDIELQKIAKKYNTTVTRYSDDITFSSNSNNFPSIQEIEKVFSNYGFTINDEKIKKLKYGQPLYVTGLSISNDKYPRVPKFIKKQIRQHLYFMKKYPKNYFYIEDNYAKLRKIYGHIIYILGIEKKLGQKYQSDFINLLERNHLFLENIYMDCFEKKINLTTYHYIDESEFFHKETQKHFLIMSIISINGDFLKNIISEQILQLKDNLIYDFRNGLTEKQREKLFHYAEDNITVKEKYISVLRNLHIEAQIMFKYENKKMDKKTYQKNYYTLFGNLMKNVLRRYKNNKNFIVVEENSKISLKELEKIIFLREKFYPNNILSKSSKDDILLSIPDYVLGIVRDCMKDNLLPRLEKLKKEQRLKEDIKFSEISDKIRLIADLNNRLFFARQNNNKISCIDFNQYIHNKILEDE